MLKFFFFIFIAVIILLPFNISLANDSQVKVYFFWGDGCPHCAEEKTFLDKLDKKYRDVEIVSYETWNNAENRELLSKVGEELNTKISGIPFTVVGDKFFTGWYDENTTGKEIEKTVKEALEGGCRDVVAEILNTPDSGEGECRKPVIEEEINVPLLGSIDVKSYSLPALSITLGILDGFNPCAMWVLLFLISLLVGMKDKVRMWTLGSAFIIASAIVYFIFMAAWLNLIIFLGFIIWVRIIIGLVALGGGAYSIRDFWINKEGACKVTGEEKRQIVFDKLRELTKSKNFLLALAGIIILAFAVNLVELICSAGLPAVFTQVLALSNLASWQYYLYILIYIFFFMLDDLIVFFIAMITLQITGLTTKYTRYTRLVGGIIMVILGILLIFRPEWLRFS